MVKWAYDGFQVNASKMLVNDGEVLVNDGDMSVWSYTHFTMIKFTCHSKIFFFLGFPHQYKTFLLYNIFKRPSLRWFRIKISQFVPC